MKRHAVTAAALLVCGALAAGPAGADGGGGDGCAPEVAAALDASARAGVEADFYTIRDPERGIRKPESILDFSCIERLFDYRAVSVFFDPGRALDELLGVVNRRICQAAREAYAGAIGRPLDGAIYADDIPRDIPGLGLDFEGGNIIDDIEGQGGGETYRTILGVPE